MKNSNSISEEEIKALKNINSVINKKYYSESEKYSIVEENIEYLKNEDDYINLLKQSFNMQSLELYYLLLSKINNYNINKELLLVLDSFVKDIKTKNNILEKNYIDYNTRVIHLINNIDKNIFKDNKCNKEIINLITSIILSEEFNIISQMSKLNIKFENDVLVNIFQNILIYKKENNEYIINILKILSSISDNDDYFYYEINDVFLGYLINNSDIDENLYKYWNEYLKTLGKNVFIDVSNKESLFKKHSKNMNSDSFLKLFRLFNDSCSNDNKLEIKYNNNDNILHKLAESRCIYEIIYRLVDRKELLSLLNKENDYNVTPLDIILSYSLHDNISLSILSFSLKILLNDNEKELNIFNSKTESKKIDDIENGCLMLYVKDKLLSGNFSNGNSHDSQYLLLIDKLLSNNDNKKNNDNKVDEDNYYTIYLKDDVKERIKECQLQEENKSVIWLNKMLDANGKKKLKTNEMLENNLEKLRNIFPNFKYFIDYVEENMYLNKMGDGFFSLPPSLIVSSPGIGKTFFLNILSKMIGVDNNFINMESVTAGFVLTGLPSHWSSAQPGLIFTNIYNSEYANNIMILDELDKTSNERYPVDNALLQILENHTAKYFKDEYIYVPMDISKSVWIATANDLSKISEPIKSRFNIFEINKPNFDERKILINEIYKTILNSHSWGKAFELNINEAVLNEMAQESNSSRDIRKTILTALAKSAKRLSNKIDLIDLDIKRISEINEWDKKND